MHVLIIEDDPALAQGLADNLRFESLEVTVAPDAEQGLQALEHGHFDLLLLDLMLPGKNGFDVLRALAGRELPRVVVVSARDAEVDIVRALDLGARDYVRKPFGLSELLARVRAQLREVASGAAGSAAPDEVRFADVRIQLARYRLWKGRQEHLLSHTEAGLLRLFLGHPGTPLPRARILSEVWGEDVYPTERTVDNFILKLRRKLEDDPTTPRFLRTVHGIGYCFSPDAGAPP